MIPTYANIQMTQTLSAISTYLPACLSRITIVYFGQAEDAYKAALLGQYEDCSLVSDFSDKCRIFDAACTNGYLDIIELMMERDIRSYNRKYYGIVSASQNGHIDVVKFLIAKGADNFDHSMNAAAQGGHLNIIELMISYGATSWDTAMGLACRYGQLDIVKFMIAKGANKWNWSLSEACYGGHVDVAKLMIAHGANDWNTGFSWACLHCQRATMELMIAQGATKCSGIVGCNLPIAQHFGQN